MKHENAIEQLEQALIERSIHSKNLIQVVNHQVVFAGKDYPLKKSVLGNGKFELLEHSVLGCYQGKAGSYQLRFQLPEQQRANGLTIRFRLSGWSDVRYLAVGHSAGKAFRHVKIANPSLDEWVTFSIGYADLAYGLKNDWEAPEVSEVPDIRLYLSGTPEHSGAEMEVQWAATWLEHHEPLAALQHKDYVINEALSDAIRKYFMRCNLFIASQVDHFFASGELPLNGDKSLPWAFDAEKPATLEESGTYRYLWHALQPAISLMVHYVDTGKVASLCAARDYMSDWLERSFFNPDPDTKYAWYDHGTAERLMAFLCMYEIGCKEDFDQRFMSRLRYAIFAHTQLLESEVFYAAHQTTRFHNHAWFQDMALIASASAFPKHKAAARWLTRGSERLIDQLNRLIVRDSGYAIFIENSIGYHHGIQRLVEFAGELVALSGADSGIPQIADELNAWSDFLRYPDNRPPSQGDTFRIPNKLDKTQVFKAKAYSDVSAVLLTQAGYGVIKGNHGDNPFMLCLFATSLCKTHKHEDNLHMTLFFDGVEWLIDPSFYSHEYDQIVPRYLRSAEAHNTIWLENRDYSIEPGCAELSGSVSGQSFDISGQHTAYQGVQVSRQLQGSLQQLDLQVQDQLSGDHGAVSAARLVFHFGEGVVVEVVDDGVVLSHPVSDYRLKLTLPVQELSKQSGEDSGSISVAGAGFMAKNDTHSIQIPLSETGQLAWRLTVSK